MGKTFKMKDLGEINTFLGIKAKKENNGITLTQVDYTKEVIKKFRHEHSKDVPTPMQQAYQHKEHEKQDNKFPVREAIGCLTYLSNATRPDIAQAVNNIARHMTKPTKRLWRAIQRVIKYLASTTHVGLHYKAGSNLNIMGYADSDFAGDTRPQINIWMDISIRNQHNFMEECKTASSYLVHHRSRILRRLRRSKRSDVPHTDSKRVQPIKNPVTNPAPRQPRSDIDRKESLAPTKDQAH
jgi:hypothetical protein